MKTLSQSLISALNSQAPMYTKKFLLYTRTWQEETETYAFSDAQDITKYILETSKIKWKLDNEGYSVWNNAILNLTLSNQNNSFDEANTFWAGAKIEVYISAKTANASANEEIKIFQGFVLEGPLYDKENRTLNISLTGQLALLDTFSAQSLTQTEELETLTPTLENPTKKFTTQNNAVSEIIAIYQGTTDNGVENATLLKAQNDYTIFDLGQYNKPAVITLNIDLPQDNSLWCTYRHYYTDKTCEWIAGQIADICAAPSRQIDPVFYSSTIEANYSCPTYNEFSEGTLNALTINNNTLQLEDNFLQDTDYSWTTLYAPGNQSVTITPSSILVVGPKMMPEGDEALFRTPATQAYGTWEAEVSVAEEDNIYQYNYFISSSDNLATTNGYLLSFEYSYDYIFFNLSRITNGQETFLKQWYYQTGRYMHRFRYRMSRSEDGTFNIWFKNITSSGDWVSVVGGAYQDNTYTTSNYQFFRMTGYGGNNVYNYQTSPLVATGSGTLSPNGTYLSPIISAGTNFKNWGKLTFQQTLNDGSGTFYMRFKDEDDVNWSAWESITNQQSLTSTKNCAQIKWEARSNSAQTQSPVLSSFVLTWEITGVNIAIVSTKDMSCLDIMKELATLSGYQIGFDSNGKFLFLNRSSNTTPSLTLEAKDIISLESLDSGLNKLYTRVKVQFGEFAYQVDPFTLEEERPNIIDKYGVKELALSSAFLPAQNANLARAAAPDIYTRACTKKQRIALICKFLPQIELGDILQINYSPFITLTVQVEGLEFDLTNWQLRLDLTEI
ncbi:MAG: hypothetical protein J5594_06060 [Elusimicrobiaceae bacterium]|nr:hypothetical protein [Elusimicrobiaceae bacterium]